MIDYDDDQFPQAPHAIMPMDDQDAITIVMPWPISSNKYWRSRIVTPKHGKPFVNVYVSPEAKEYVASVKHIAHRMRLTKPFRGRLHIDIDVFPHRPQDYKKRIKDHGDVWADTVSCVDIDNAIKVTLDSLKGIAFVDDRQVFSLSTVRHNPDDKPKRLVIRIERLAPEPLEFEQGTLI